VRRIFIIGGKKEEAVDLQISPHDDEEVGPVSQLGLE
jgi:hypothetical protein